MSKYDTITGWFTDHWITALALVVVAVVIAIPQFRDGVVLLWNWARRLVRRLRGKPTDSEPFVFDAEGEQITYTELLRSSIHDVVVVHAHTHPLGVAAEYAWIGRRYPESEWLGQALTTLQLMAGNSKYDQSQVHFDVITVKTKDGQEKEVYFDISSFFAGGCSTTLNPQEFLGQKLLQIYSNKNANKPSEATSQ